MPIENRLSPVIIGFIHVADGNARFQGSRKRSNSRQNTAGMQVHFKVF